MHGLRSTGEDPDQGRLRRLRRLRWLGVAVIAAWAVSGYLLGTARAVPDSPGYGLRTLV